MDISDAIIREATADRPDPGIEGRVNFNTTTGLIERDSGSAWEGPTTAGTIVGVILGLYADIPDPGRPGLLFFATDTSIMYIDDGTAWLAVSGGVGVWE